VASIGDQRDECRILLGKPPGERALERPRITWVEIRVIRRYTERIRGR
jgi:hypothetical protein